LHVAAERRELGDGGALSHAELATTVAQEIEHRDPLGDARGMIGGELEDAVAEPDLPGALACGGEEGFGRRRMRIFLEEMMLDDPGIVVIAAVGGLKLRQRVLIKLQLVALNPRARQLQLVEDTEFHDVSPKTDPRFLPSVIPMRPKSSGSKRMAIPRYGRALDRNTRMISLWALESPARLVSRKRHDQLHPASGFRAESRRRLAQGQAGQERHAAGVPPVRLCRHRQDHAGAPYRRRR